MPTPSSATGSLTCAISPELAQAAEYNGFEPVLTPTGRWCQDSWLATAALLGATERLKFLVAYRPSLVPATLLAQQAQTYQELSGNRLLLNVVVGGEDAEQRAYGDYSTKEQRYGAADESLDLVHRLWTESDPVDVHGDHISVDGASLARRPSVVPPVFFGGSSPAGIETASKRADVYLTWGEHPDDVAAKLETVSARAAVYGRTLDYGIRLHVISRDTEEEAWAVAQKIYDSIDPDDVARAQAGLRPPSRSGSAGCRRSTAVARDSSPAGTPGRSNSLRDCGPASDCSVAERALRSSVPTIRLPRPSMRSVSPASDTSSFRAIRIWRRASRWGRGPFPHSSDEASQ